MHPILRRRRRELGLTQAQAAKEAGMSEREYRALETGRAIPDDNQVTGLARALQIEASHLVRIRQEATEFSAHPGDRIRSARRSKGWSQDDLARRVQRAGYFVSRQMIARLEAGALRHPDPRALTAIAAALDIPPGELGAPDPFGLMVPAEILADMAWELFYTGSEQVRHLAPMIRVWLAGAGTASDNSARLWQLYGVLLRDANDASGAIQALSNGIEHAERIKDPNLLAAGLMRRARAWADLGATDPDAIARALSDGERALRLAPECAPRLRGALMTQWIKTLALAPDADALTLHRRAHEAANLAAIYGGRDPTGMHLDAIGVTHAAIDGAITLVQRQGMRPGDSEIIRAEGARMRLDPRLGRWSGALLLSMAHLFTLTAEPEAALETIETAIPRLTSARRRRRARALLAALPPSAARRAVEERLHD